MKIFDKQNKIKFVIFLIQKQKTKIGKMPKSYSPKPDVLLVSQDAKKLRNNIFGFLPTIGLSMIDYGRSAEIDKFYILCQNHRDFYKDYTGRTPLVKEFIRFPKKYASRPHPTEVYVAQPMRYMVEPRPVVYPETVQRRGRPKEDGTQINVYGRYAARSCIKYKR